MVGILSYVICILYVCMPCLWIDLHRMVVSILYLACFFCTHITEMWIQEVRVLRVSIGMCVCIFVRFSTHISEMCIQEVRDLGSVYVTFVYVCIFGCTSICLSWFPLHTHFRDVHPRSEGSWVCVCYICVSIYLYVCLYVWLIL